MKKRTATFLTIAVAASALVAFAQAPAAPVQQGGRWGGEEPTHPGPNANSQYGLGPDSMPQEGVPKGEIRGPFVLPSNAYPGTQHTYWVYVPAQYDPAAPASLMVFRSEERRVGK